jgi:hypothetical protein
MNNVIQLFPAPKPYVRSAEAIALAERIDMEHTMQQLEHTLKCYKELVVTMENPRDMFVARQFVNETKEALDVMYVEYHRKYGRKAN